MIAEQAWVLKNEGTEEASPLLVEATRFLRPATRPSSNLVRLLCYQT